MKGFIILLTKLIFGSHVIMKYINPTIWKPAAFLNRHLQFVREDNNEKPIWNIEFNGNFHRVRYFDQVLVPYGREAIMSPRSYYLEKYAKKKILKALNKIVNRKFKEDRYGSDFNKGMGNMSMYDRTGGMGKYDRYGTSKYNDYGMMGRGGNSYGRESAYSYGDNSRGYGRNKRYKGNRRRNHRVGFESSFSSESSYNDNYMGRDRVSGKRDDHSRGNYYNDRYSSKSRGNMLGSSYKKGKYNRKDNNYRQSSSYSNESDSYESSYSSDGNRDHKKSKGRYKKSGKYGKKYDGHDDGDYRGKDKGRMNDGGHDNHGRNKDGYSNKYNGRQNGGMRNVGSSKGYFGRNRDRDPVVPMSYLTKGSEESQLTPNKNISEKDNVKGKHLLSNLLVEEKSISESENEHLDEEFEKFKSSKLVGGNEKEGNNEKKKEGKSQLISNEKKHKKGGKKNKKPKDGSGKKKNIKMNSQGLSSKLLINNPISANEKTDNTNVKEKKELSQKTPNKSSVSGVGGMMNMNKQPVSYVTSKNVKENEQRFPIDTTGSNEKKINNKSSTLKKEEKNDEKAQANQDDNDRNYFGSNNRSSLFGFNERGSIPLSNSKNTSNLVDKEDHQLKDNDKEKNDKEDLSTLRNDNAEDKEIEDEAVDDKEETNSQKSNLLGNRRYGSGSSRRRGRMPMTQSRHDADKYYQNMTLKEGFYWTIYTIANNKQDKRTVIMHNGRCLTHRMTLEKCKFEDLHDLPCDFYFDIYPESRVGLIRALREYLDGEERKSKTFNMGQNSVLPPIPVKKDNPCQNPCTEAMCCGDYSKIYKHPYDVSNNPNLRYALEDFIMRNY